MTQTDKYTHVWCLVVILTHSFRSFSACSLHPQKLHSIHFAKIKLSTAEVMHDKPHNSEAAAAGKRKQREEIMMAFKN